MTRQHEYNRIDSVDRSQLLLHSKHYHMLTQALKAYYETHGITADQIAAGDRDTDNHEDVLASIATMELRKYDELLKEVINKAAPVLWCVLLSEHEPLREPKGYGNPTLVWEDCNKEKAQARAEKVGGIVVRFPLYMVSEVERVENVKQLTELQRARQTEFVEPQREVTLKYTYLQLAYVLSLLTAVVACASVGITRWVYGLQ